MPIMCTINMPLGKSVEQKKAVLAGVSQVLMKELDMKPTQVRVSIVELPKNHYIAGGVMAYEMPEFDGETEG